MMDDQLTFTPQELTLERHPLGITVRYSLARLPRQRCHACRARRVCYAVGITDIVRGPALCAKCAGIR
jgi:hypothetical protein